MSQQQLESDGRIDALREAIDEAQRFIERAALAIEELDTPEPYNDGKGGIKYSRPSQSVAYAGAKRSSLDLTRALAKLRKARR